MSNVASLVRLEEIESGLFKLVFDAQGTRMNILNKAAIAELERVVMQLSMYDVRGLMLISAKDSFIPGADITEFCDTFSHGEMAILEYSQQIYSLFNRIEDMPFPTLAAIQGIALGGGLELALSTDFRILSSKAKIGLPEVNLGILPGWGGTVRLPRVIGVENSLQWMIRGQVMNASEALDVGVADAVVKEEALEASALTMLCRAADGRLDYRQRRQRKIMPLNITELELNIACQVAQEQVAAIAKPQYPAAHCIISTVRESAVLPRNLAQQVEARRFAELAMTDTARNLVTLFLNEQALKKSNRHYVSTAGSPRQAAVVGAGVMGAGIACQSAIKDKPIVMKDIRQEALARGVEECNRLLVGQTSRGITSEAALFARKRIIPTLSYDEFSEVDLVVEAVVEDFAIKQSLLIEVEQSIKPDCVLATNTSSFSVTQLSSALARPERFCGMHFFNPIYRMPLVEVIRGEQTSSATISQAIAYAVSLNQMPIVVSDCAGFLVNRILFSYLHAFHQLVLEGIDFERIDRLMEDVGWPMGPASLMDVVGLDTEHSVFQSMTQAYPDRLPHGVENATNALLKAGRLGQKSASGYYRYEVNECGKLSKKSAPETHSILASLVNYPTEISDEVIIHRMMIPLCLEACRCLEEGVVVRAGDIDVALVNGIGFPRYLGGAFGYMDTMGLDYFIRQCETFAYLGKAYEPTAKLMGRANKPLTPVGQTSQGEDND